MQDEEFIEKLKKVIIAAKGRAVDLNIYIGNDFWWIANNCNHINHAAFKDDEQVTVYKLLKEISENETK